jgi:hypothetical protein
MNLLAKLLAHALFAIQRPWVFVRQNRTLLSLFVVTTAATVFATLGATALIDKRPFNDAGDASMLGTFISANGTTQKSWQIAGPFGPGLYAGDAGGVLIEIEGGAEPIADFGDTLNTMTLQPGVSLAGAAGAGNVSLGSMTGATTLPTGNLNWAGASGKNMTLTGDSTAGASVVSDIGTGIIVRATNGTAELTGVTAEVIGTTTSRLGSNGISVVGGVASFGSGPTLTIGTPTSGTFIPGDVTTLPCTAGGTQTVSSQQLAFIVTTGVLTSNCVIDFSVNATSGVFFIDMSGATPGATSGIQFSNGTATKTYTSSSTISGTIATVWTHGANTLAVSW